MKVTKILYARRNTDVAVQKTKRQIPEYKKGIHRLCRYKRKKLVQCHFPILRTWINLLSHVFHTSVTANVIDVSKSTLSKVTQKSKVYSYVCKPMTSPGWQVEYLNCLKLYEKPRQSWNKPFEWNLFSNPSHVEVTPCEINLVGCGFFSVFLCANCAKN